MSDLIERAEKLLVPCGIHDYGLAMECTCTECADPRPIISELLAEIARLTVIEAASHRGVRLSEVRWKMMTTSGHLWGWGALYPHEKAPAGTPAHISPQDCDRIVDAALGKVRGLLEMWFEDGQYHHCSGCGKRGPLRHEGSIYICADCNASGVKVVN